MEEVADAVVLVEGTGLVVGVVEETLEARVAGRPLAAGARSRAASSFSHVLAARSSISTARRGSSRSARKSARSSDVPRCLVRRVAQRLEGAVLNAAIERALADASAARPRLTEGVLRRAVEGRQAHGELVQLRSCASEVGEQRGRLARDVPELDHRRLELDEEVVEQVEVAREVVASLSRGRRGLAGVLDEGRDVLAAIGERADDLVGVHVQVADHGVLAAEEPQARRGGPRARARRGGSPRSGSRGCRPARFRTR